MQDIQAPTYLASFLRLNKMGLTYWADFKRKPKFNHKEKLICLISGSEKIRMVSGIFKQNMYSGVYEDLDPLDTPINLFETDP
jgi:hypothetical protein